METNVEIISYDYSSNELTISIPNENEPPKVGDIVCSGITDEAPYGYLMQVGEVKQLTSTKAFDPITTYVLIADASATIYGILKALNVDAEDLQFPLIAETVAFVDESGNTIYKKVGKDAGMDITTIEVPLSVNTNPGKLSLTYTNKISVPAFDFYFDGGRLRECHNG